MNAVAPTYTARYATGEKSEREHVVDLFCANLWPIAWIPPDMETVILSIFAAIAEQRVIVLERENRIVGCAKFDIGKFWYTPRTMVFESGCFVVPEYRKTYAPFRLFQALQDEARKRDALLIMGAGTKDATVAPNLLKRYPHIASAFLVDPNNV